DVAPSLDPAGLAELARYYRRCASPGAAVALLKMNTDVDVRDVLPTIRVPSVVMHRTADRDANVEEGRFIAAHIPGARFVEFPGADHSWWTQGRDAILDEIEELVTGARPVPQPNRVPAHSVIVAGRTSSCGIARRCDESSSAFAGERSTPPAMASSWRSMVQRARFAARSPSVAPCIPLESSCGRASTPVSASCSGRRSPESPSTRVLGYPPSPRRMKCSFPRRSATWSQAPASCSRTAASTSSRAWASVE